MRYDEKAELLPEHPVPQTAAECMRCDLCKQRSRIIWGEGNPNGKLIVILDNPGSREDNEGQPLLCGTRRTLQEAASSSGFHLDDLYVTYVLKCRPKRKYDKSVAVCACIGYLEQQLVEHRYMAAFCLGDRAVKAFFNDPDITVKESRNTQHLIRGLATFVSYHPLAVRRRPNLYPYFLDDWKTVYSYINGQ
jgi:DNA polymerase